MVGRNSANHCTALAHFIHVNVNCIILNALLCNIEQLLEGTKATTIRKATKDKTMLKYNNTYIQNVHKLFSLRYF